MKDKPGKQHCLPIWRSWPGGWGIFGKGGTSEEENSIYTLHHFLAKISKKWCKVYAKTDPSSQKPYEEFGILQTSMSYFCPKNTFLQLKTYLAFDGLL